MPRISRNTVQFEAGGKTWLASFQHLHSDLGLTDGLTGLVVRHVTLCQLSYKGQHPYLVGESRCSLKDTYDWRKGLKVSLIRALSVAGIWPRTGVDLKFDIPGRGDSDGRLFGECLRSFFDEINWRSYPPHVPEGTLVDVVEAVVEGALPTIKGFLPSPRLTGTTPEANQHGLGYVGA